MIPGTPIRIGLVAHQFVHPDTCGALYSVGDLGRLDVVTSTFVDIGRCHVADRFMEQEDEKYMLFCDSDMTFQREDVLRLIADMEKHPDIGCLSAICTFRDGSYKPVAHWIEGEGDEESYVSGKVMLNRTIDYMEQGAIADVSLQGTGFMMVRKEAMEGLEVPYFSAGYDENGNYWGEDIRFVEAIRNNGWRTCIDFGVKVGHIGTVVYHPDILFKIRDKQPIAPQAV